MQVPGVEELYVSYSLFYTQSLALCQVQGRCAKQKEKEWMLVIDCWAWGEYLKYLDFKDNIQITKLT